MTPDEILIVDDDRIVCHALGEQLVEEGFRVHTASSGKEALRRYGKKGFGLAYINLIMDPMDGIETAKKLKRLNPFMSVVLMSGLPEELEMRRMEISAAGACDVVLDKPITVDIGRFTRRLLKNRKNISRKKK